ncbi:MAG: ribosomal protein glutamine methyltransferase [Steroidobacteraceae bacterium]|nr:ribosomal protein glutamine methyltransferase [Steroidobacteraceae bacterium]
MTAPATPAPFASRPPRSPTVAQLVEFGAREFDAAGLAFGHGTGDATDDAAALVFHALDLDHGQAAAAYEHKVGPAELENVLSLFAERLRRRVPAAYLMRRMWFAGLEFEVDERVIVPRSPFAELIQAGFAPWVEPDAVRRVLDIGTGSGCIAVACAVRFPASRVDAVDLSPDALAVARRNVARHGLDARVALHQGDVYEPLADRCFELIVSNPPYVSDAEMAALPEEYRHEPDMALRAGADGLDVVRRILHGAERHLAPGGVLVVEVGDSEERLQRAFPSVPFLWLEFERGGGGVFVLTKDDLGRHRRALTN